ncbi:MAG TPA: calcium/sodium antiporter [Thermodesulfobacteriota bacterium]|nr:calcium/sodium antiporter [Thermodesulfobacteriota bacterium]
MVLLLFVAGLILLIVGAEALVRGSSRLAASIGISPLVIGLTVVAFGTSSPELAISINSTISAQANIAVGNIIGSNIFNVLFILGLSALITPLSVSQQLVRLDVPLMIVVSVLVLVLGADTNISRVEGFLLFMGLVAYIVFLIYQSQKESKEVYDEYAKEYGSKSDGKGNQWLTNTGLVLGGLGLLVLGSRWLVASAVSIAQYLGVSELIIGLTIIAAGTSLPEVVTSVIASVRGERDIAVGNVVGSNLFNIMGVLGLASVVAPDGIEVSTSALRFDIPVMIVVALACLPVFFTGSMIARWEGALFLGYYMAYTLYLMLAATRHAALPVFNVAMLYFVIPLTLLTLIIVTTQSVRSRGKNESQ